MSSSIELETVLDLLGDRTVRRILIAAVSEPCSARDIAEALDVAPSTVYRHVDDLLEADLLAEQLKLEPDGSHHRLFVTRLEHVDIDLEPDGFTVRVGITQTPSERFAHVWDTIRQG